MKQMLILLVVTLASRATAPAQDGNFQLKISGLLAEKIGPETELKFWYPASDTSDWAEFKLSELPLTLPFEQFKGHDWHVNFVGDNHATIFSITLSRDLFDKPRTIDIKLDPPSPQIRPIFGITRDIRYTAAITKRMRYRSLPRWDNERDTFAASMPPAMTISAIGDGSTIYDGKLSDGCMGSRWFAIIDPKTTLRDGESYRMTVEYDSGGLFPAITTTLDFHFDAQRHGR